MYLKKKMTSFCSVTTKATHFHIGTLYSGQLESVPKLWSLVPGSKWALIPYGLRTVMYTNSYPIVSFAVLLVTNIIYPILPIRTALQSLLPSIFSRKWNASSFCKHFQSCPRKAISAFWLHLLLSPGICLLYLACWHWYVLTPWPLACKCLEGFAKVRPAQSLVSGGSP